MKCDCLCHALPSTNNLNQCDCCNTCPICKEKVPEYSGVEHASKCTSKLKDREYIIFSLFNQAHSKRAKLYWKENRNEM